MWVVQGLFAKRRGHCLSQSSTVQGDFYFLITLIGLLYLLDAQGDVRYRQFGEGEYGRTEREIQKSLAEHGGHPSNHLAVVAPLGAEVAADLRDGTEITQNMSTARKSKSHFRSTYPLRLPIA